MDYDILDVVSKVRTSPLFEPYLGPSTADRYQWHEVILSLCTDVMDDIMGLLQREEA